MKYLLPTTAAALLLAVSSFANAITISNYYIQYVGHGYNNVFFEIRNCDDIPYKNLTVTMDFVDNNGKVLETVQDSTDVDTNGSKEITQICNPTVSEISFELPNELLDETKYIRITQVTYQNDKGKIVEIPLENYSIDVFNPIPLTVGRQKR